MSTPKKRRIYTSRYIGDLGSPHVATPRRAKKTLQFVKEVVKKKNKQVKLLQQQNRRFIKKIRTLKMLLEHLKDKSLITDEAQDTILVG